MTLSVNVKIIVLDVVVTDKKGNVVNTPLSAEDFTIYEDNIQQRIRNFEKPIEHMLPQVERAVVTSAADLPKIGDAPVNILVIDELNTRFEDESSARQSLEKYLKHQPAILQQPTELLATTNTKFIQLHDFTQDRDALLGALHKHVPQYPWRAMNAGKGPGAVELLAQSMSALLQIAQASNGIKGRKSVIWVGKGFPGANPIGMPPGEVDTIEAAMKRVTDALLTSRITFYGIDPTINSTTTSSPVISDTDGITDDYVDTGDPFEDGINFASLAPTTGGRFFYSRNDVDQEIAEGIDSANQYYTISYTPTTLSEDQHQYRKIRIVMSDPNLRAVTRAGYFADPGDRLSQAAQIAPSAKQAQASLRMELSSAVSSTMSYNGLEVQATAVKGNLWVIRVPTASLNWTAKTTGGSQAEVTIVAAGFDKQNKMIGHVARELTVSRQSDSPKTAGDDANFSLPFSPPAGTVRLRFVVRDAVSGKIGTVDIDQP